MKANYKDALTLLSTVTPRKVLNFGALIGSYYLSKLIKRPFHWGYLSSISIEPTTSCNLRCPQCPSGLRAFTRPTGMLDDDLFEKTLDSIHNHLLYLIFYFQGEPYLNPRFLKMVSYAHKKNIYTATSTNAHYLTSDVAEATVKSGLSRIIISIDGTTQSTFEKYRVGGNLTQVVEGTKNLVAWKRKLKSATPFIIFQFIVMKHNEHQIPEIKALAESVGVDELQLKTAQIYDEKGIQLLPDNPEYARYEASDNGLAIKNKLLNSCWKMWHSCVLTWDGSVVPCCFDKDANHSLGNIVNQTINQIWKNQAYQIFRTQIAKSRKEIEICRNCSEGTKIFG